MPENQTVSDRPKGARGVESIDLLASALLALAPPLPPGFSRWVWRGEAYRSTGAIMVTSLDPSEDGGWDPPMMFQTEGHARTVYLEAVIDHHDICGCVQCQANIPDQEREASA